MSKFFTVSLFLFFLPAFVFAQSAQSNPSAPDYEKAIKEARKAQLEMIKNTNPEIYESTKADMERQDKIQKIVSLVREGKLSESQAEGQLYPLIKEEVQTFVGGSDREIKRLERQIDFLKKAKMNPGQLINSRIDILLGKKTPNPEDFMY